MAETFARNRSHITAGRKFPISLAAVVRTYLTIVTPLLLTMLSVRVVMTPLFLRLEYNRPGFPADIFGFTKEDRLEYGPYAVNYLLNGEDITFLSDLRTPGGERLFNNRELRHMHDVKHVTRMAFAITIFAATGALLGSAYLWRGNSYARAQLRQGLFNGSVLTLGIIFSLVIAAIVSWNTFFDSFHETFFADGTWIFAFSDTLIRLFPQQFWFDTALIIGGITTISATIILLATWRLGKSGPV